MATVAESLFGVTPESLQATREQQLQQQALQFAQLSPMQAAQAGFYTAGSRLGTGIGGLLGAQDPELMRVRQRQELLQGVDISDPEALRGAASRLLQSGDSPAAAELAKRALDIEKAQAQITKDTAAAAASEAAAKRDRTPSTPEAIAKAQRIAALRSAIPAYEAAGDTVTAKQLKDELNALLPADKLPSFGAEADRVAVATFGKPFSELTQAQAKQVDDILEKRGITKAQAGRTTIAPEIKMAPDIVGAVNAADKATEKEVAMLDSARLAKRLINETANSNNSQTWEAARTTIAKAVGENKLSNEDIRRTGVDPRLVQGALDWVNKKIEGVPNQDIQKQLFMLGSVLENNAAARYDAKVSRYRGAAEAAKFPGQPSTYFPTAAERTQQAPQSNVRDWNSLK